MYTSPNLWSGGWFECPLWCALHPEIVPAKVVAAAPCDTGRRAAVCRLYVLVRAQQFYAISERDFLGAQSAYADSRDILDPASCTFVVNTQTTLLLSVLWRTVGDFANRCLANSRGVLKPGQNPAGRALKTYLQHDLGASFGCTPKPRQRVNILRLFTTVGARYRSQNVNCL